MDISDHGLLHLYKHPRVVVNGLRGIQNALVKCLFIINWTWIHWGF